MCGCSLEHLINFPELPPAVVVRKMIGDKIACPKQAIGDVTPSVAYLHLLGVSIMFLEQRV